MGDQLSLNAGQKYCRMLQGEHSAILLTIMIKLPIVVKISVLSFLSGCLRCFYCIDNCFMELVDLLYDEYFY